MLKVKVILAKEFYSEESKKDRRLVKNLSKLGFKFSEWKEKTSVTFCCENSHTNEKQIKFKTIQELKEFMKKFGKIIIDLEKNEITIYNSYIES